MTDNKRKVLLLLVLLPLLLILLLLLMELVIQASVTSTNALGVRMSAAQALA
jgi:hypothetical protein